MQIVLASASPRRQQLLRDAGVKFVAEPANIAEVQFAHETARQFAERMAREKAQAVRNETEHEETCVLGADTVVVVTTGSAVAQEVVLGKPIDEADAARMLRLLSARKHQVITGVCLLGNGFEDTRSEGTDVYFSEMSENDICEYIRTGEPMDKAGAYAIQGAASRWIAKIEGDYSNVVGLPVGLVLRMLREHGALRD